MRRLEPEGCPASMSLSSRGVRCDPVGVGWLLVLVALSGVVSLSVARRALRSCRRRLASGPHGAPGRLAGWIVGVG